MPDTEERFLQDSVVMKNRSKLEVRKVMTLGMG